MSITKPFINKFLSLMLVLSVVITGLIPTTAVYASEVNTPGSKSSSSVTLTTEGLLLSVTVPTSVLIYVDEHGEVTTPDYLQITNHSIAPVYAHTLEVTPFNGWTLDPSGTSYKGTKLNNNKHYWLSFNGLDPSDGPINLSTLISGHSSLNLDLLADVAPQREAIHAFNIGEIIVTVGWDINEDVQEPVIPPDTGSFTVGEVYHEYADGYGDFVFIPLLTGGVGNYRIIIAAEGGDPETQALVNELVYKESEESCTPGVPLPGYNPEQTYEVYVTYLDDEESETIIKVLSPTDTGSFTVGEVYHEYADGYGDYVFIPLLTGGVGDYRIIIVAEGTDPETQALTDEVREKKSEGSTTVGVPLPGYNPEQTYEVYVTYLDDEESETIMKVLLAAYGSETGDDDSGSGGNQEFGFSVEGATHVGYKTFALTLTVTEPDNYLFAAVPPNAPIPSPLSPPPASCLEYIYDAGVHELEIVFSYATNDMTEADIYIWRLNDYDHIGPVKVEVREAEGEDSETETENTEPNGEYIPEGYVLATDADFSGTQDGYFKYIGSDDYVVIPHVIKGVPITSYGEMFKGTGVKGVASNNPNIISMMSMFEGATSSTLELIYLDTSSVTDMRSMFRNNQATSLDLSNFDTSNVTLMIGMFAGSQATSLDLSNFDTSQVTDMSHMFSESKATVLDLSSFDMSNFDGSNTQYSSTRMLWSCAATIGYARTQADADILNSVSGKPYYLTFYPQGYEPPEPPEQTGPEWVLAKDSDFNGFTDGEFTYKGTAEYVIIPDKIKYLNVTSYANMFKGTAVKGVKSTNPNVTDMTGMFENSTAESLDLSELDTSGVISMRGMFKNSAATTLDLSNFDTSNVTTMREMFSFSNATVLDLSSFDLSKVTVTIDMLSGAKATTGYARTTVDANKLNSVSGKPLALNFVVK